MKNKDSKQNSWRRYATGIISVCKYLKRFDDIKDFIKYCNSFNGSIELPLEMQKNIKGMGFALACSLLKENSFTNYCKPDVHLKDVLSLTELCSNDDISIFNCVSNIAKANNTNSYTVDKKYG